VRARGAVPDRLAGESELLLVTIVVAAETLILAVVGLFVVALLRSHAEILRRLEQLAPDSGLPQPHERPLETLAAPDLHGSTPDGGARQISLGPGPDHLLAFLSTSCSVCVQLLQSLAAGEAAIPPGLRLVIVAKDRRFERLRLLRSVSDRVDIVLSSAAWEDYRVPGSPYFVHVDGSTRSVVGEGSVSAWDQVVSLILDAAEDRAGYSDHPERIDAALAAAGIGPGHPSLRPTAVANSDEH
jgi:hypothetical protein